MDSVRLAASLLCPSAVLIALCYAALCAASPFGRCRNCRGIGRDRLRRRGTGRLCPYCDATGIRIRYGRHLWNEISHIHRHGNR